MMAKNIRFKAFGSLAIVALALNACGAGQPRAYGQSPDAPTYGNGPGGMMDGGMMGTGHLGGGMMGSGMMGGMAAGQSAPTAEPTPVGATPVAVSEEIHITAASARFTPTQVTVKPGAIVRFVVTNNDGFLHNFVSQPAGIPLLNLPVNTAQTVTWTAPTTAGTYSAVCTLHPGMSLTITVNN
jgi:plastocyanin